MTSVINSVTSWLGGSRERDRSPVDTEKLPSPTQGSEDQNTGNETTTADATTPTNAEEQSATTPVDGATSTLPIDVNIHEMSEKAVTAAKEWGNYFFNFGKVATEQVAKTAKQLKETVEEKTIIGDFSREQDKFISEHKEKKKQSEAAVPPWVGYNEEESMKVQILALSKDKRNFLRNPPAGVQFNFDYGTNFPVAMVLLDEDPILREMRFKIVPKEIKEELFWRNYFYRVSLIKQSTQLTSLAQHSGSKVSASRAAVAAKAESTPPVQVTGSDSARSPAESDEMPVGSPSAIDQEFASDAFQAGTINADELKKEMYQLGMSEQTTEDIGKKKKVAGSDDVPDWEKELQAELQEYEVVDDGNNVDDADLEREIMNQIEAESKQA